MVLLAGTFYGQTVGFDYALDDGLVLYDNPYVQHGLDFEKGIKPIFTKDTYHGFYEQKGSTGELTGGRYRPLSVFTFAVKYAFFGENPGLSHLINLLLYGATLAVLLLLFHKYWFRDRPVLAFLAVLIFAIHPIHTEVVANIKSRDEILSLLFLSIGMYLLFRHVNRSKKFFSSDLAWALTFYLLALFSKENGITFLAVIPVALFVFTKYKWPSALKTGSLFIFPAMLYLAVRFSVTGTGGGGMDDVMNDPFLLASTGEKYATVFVILLHYLKLLFFPHPLAYDYSYAQLPYYNFGDIWPWLSILAHGLLLAFAIIKFKKYAVLPFAILYYFFTLSIVSNLFVDLGGTMGERLAYHSSLGFSIAIACLLVKFLGRYRMAPNQSKRNLGWMVIVALVVLSGYKTVTRNEDWRNNRALFIEDVEKVPGSIRANVAAAGELINIYFENANEETRQGLQQALGYLTRAEEIYPHRDNYLVNLLLQKGYAAFYSGNTEIAENSWQRASGIHPGHAKLTEYFHVLGNHYHQQGRKAGSQNNYEEAVLHLEKAVNYAPESAVIWYDLGGAYFSVDRFQKAADAFREALRFDPGMQEAQQGLQAAQHQIQQPRP